MKKNLLIILIFLTTLSSTVQAAIDKIAIVDMQKVISKSSQVQALKNEQDKKRKELAQFIKKAGEDIQKQTDPTQKKALAQKYDKDLKAKQNENAKTYKTKLEAVDKSINTIIAQQAKLMGYDAVYIKGAIIYGGDDITESILKVIK